MLETVRHPKTAEFLRVCSKPPAWIGILNISFQCFLREHVMSPKVLHFYMQMISSLEKLIFMKKELKKKLKKNRRIKETSCKKKRNAIVARVRIRTVQLAKPGRLTIVSTKQSLCVLSKTGLLIYYTFVFQSVTHILVEVIKLT